MKIFLGNAPWKKPGFYGVRAGSRWPHFEREGCPYMPFPFYLAYATAILEKAGHQCALVDGIAEDLTEAQFFSRLKEFAPDLILYEVSTASINTDIRIAKETKQILKVPIIFAGPHIYMYEEDFLKEHSEVDFIAYGEYEYTLKELIQQINQPESYSSITGLIYRDGKGMVHKNPRRPLIENLDELPWPARHHLPMYRYHDAPGGIPLPSLQMWASRGCPFKCIFCSWPQIMYGGHKYRTRNPGDVVNEIESCVKEYGFKSFYFDDDTFNIGKARILQLCEEIQKKSLNLPWAVMARADTADKEMLLAMKKAGLVAIKYGIESSNQAIVDAAQKNLDLQKAIETIRITREVGINMHLTFTFGLPGETWDTIKQTIRFAKKMNPDTVQFSINTPFPGSAYFEKLDKEGRILTKDWDKYDGYNTAVLNTEFLSNKDLEAAVRLAYKNWELHKLFRLLREGKYLKKAFLHPLKGYNKVKEIIHRYKFPGN